MTASGRIEGKRLGLDYGLARIGVAVSDPLGLAARPLTVLRRRSRRQDFARLAALAAQEEVTAVVCGLPLLEDGAEGAQAQRVRRWAERLAHALRTLLGESYPIFFWDEALSSFAAQEILCAAGDEKVEDDAIAAAVILQSYLDAQRRGDERTYGEIRLPPKKVMEHV